MGDRLTAETLCDRITRESLRHGFAIKDGKPFCDCGIPAPESWDQHLAEALAAVFAPEMAELATRAAEAEAAIERVREVHRKLGETTCSTGPYCSCGTRYQGWPCRTIHALDGDQ